MDGYHAWKFAAAHRLDKRRLADIFPQGLSKVFSVVFTAKFNSATDAFALKIGSEQTAYINIGVSVELFPVTGQPLPLISSGGTSIWMTCIAIGIIQSVMDGQEISTEIDDSDNPLEILNQAV